MIEQTSHTLPAGYAITVSVAAGATPVQVSCAETSSIGALIRIGSRTFGPYLAPLTFTVTGTATVTAALATMAASFSGLLIENAGAPTDAVQAAANVNPAGDDNGLTYTAAEYGAVGNVIGIRYVDPGEASQSLAVSVDGNLITVSLATAVNSSITSTAAEVLAAVNAHAVAGKMVAATIYTADSGSADDGSGVVTAMARANLSGGAGTGIYVAKPGCLCVDTTNADVYRNDGTLAAPAWIKLGDAA